MVELGPPADKTPAVNIARVVRSSVTGSAFREFNCLSNHATVRDGAPSAVWPGLALQQPLGQKGSDCVECLSSSVEPAHSGDESVRHSHPYVQLGVDARRDGAFHVAA